CSDKGLFKDVSQWLAQQIWDQARKEVRIVGGLNSHGELHGGLGHLYGFFRTLELCAVDDIGPANQLFHRTRIKAEFLLRHMRQKLGAGFVFRIEKLMALIANAIVLRVFRREKSALM